MAISAVVSNGNLLIELDDGTVVNAGRVQGMTGAQGPMGLEGPRGADGRAGRDGRDGATIHTGLGVPDTSQYRDGDLYIDVQTVDLSLYQKIGGQWARLGGLKGQPGAPGAAGKNGAAGGGGSVIIYPSPDGNGPNTDNGGNPINEGDMWFDPENGYIWVWDGSQWLPVADKPPVIISPDPPEYNNSSNEDPTKDPQYPVVPGDLWFDSDQLALYVATENSSFDLVWVISTPHNREGLSDIVSIIRPDFAFPRAVDKQIEYNPVTDTEYIYNAPKNQWIDLSQMVHYGTQPPCHAPKGAVFTDEDTLKQFIHQGDCVWVEQTSCGAGPGSPISGNLTAVEFNGYRARSYQGQPGGQRTILHEFYWETQEGIHFEDEHLVEVDMNNTDNWEDVHQLSQTVLDAYGIYTLFNAEVGAVSFLFDYKGTHDGPWDPHPTYPCARIRMTVTNKNKENSADFTMVTSEASYVFPEYKQDPKEETPVPAHPGAGC